MQARKVAEACLQVTACMLRVLDRQVQVPGGRRSQLKDRHGVPGAAGMLHAALLRQRPALLQGCPRFVGHAAARTQVLA